MADAVRSLVLLALAAAALTALAGGAGWWFEASRRLRRAVRRVLGAEPGAEAIDRHHGRAAGLDIEARSLAVLWDGGGSGLVYSFDEVEGAELIIDGHVAARVFRGEPKRQLDALGRDADQVALRLIFDDERFPEFELELWGRQSAFRAGAESPADAVRAGRRWLAHVDALVRRPRGLPPRPTPVADPLFDRADPDEDGDDEAEAPF